MKHFRILKSTITNGNSSVIKYNVQKRYLFFFYKDYKSSIDFECDKIVRVLTWFDNDEEAKNFVTELQKPFKLIYKGHLIKKVAYSNKFWYLDLTSYRKDPMIYGSDALYTTVEGIKKEIDIKIPEIKKEYIYADKI